MSLIRWRYIDDSPTHGSLNMATDFALLMACNEGITPPTLRLYGWNQPTLSIGYSRNGENIIDLARCRQQDVSVVRRPTGGRILFHHKELTYCIVAPSDHPSFPNGIRQTYQAISQILTDCLNQLDLKGNAIVSLKPQFEKQGKVKSKACFAFSNRFEVMVDGKKVVGSAQRRLNKAFLQHGSIMLHFDYERLNHLLRFPNQELRDNHLTQLKYNSSDLQTLCKKPISFVELKKVFIKNLSQKFFKEVIPGKLTDYEIALRNRFVEQNQFL